MASKGRKLLSESPPPAAASSSSDQHSEDNSSSEEEQEVKTQKDPKPAAESDTESDSDSDSDLPPPLKVKPIASVKRPALENDKTPGKKAKTDKAESSGGVTRDESGGNKKVLFQRLWSEEDELVILKGMIDYKAKKGRDAIAFPDDFLEFIKKSLDFVDANKSQIVNKVQRLKKKYENAKKRKITNPNELKAFQLSKQVWGGDDVKVEEDNGVGENHKGKSINPKLKPNNKGGLNGQALDDGKKLESRKKKGVEEISGMVNSVITKCQREMSISVIGGGNSLLGFFNEGVLKEGMKLLGERDKAEITEKLRKHNVMEMELYLKRLDVIREVTQKTLNAAKSAQN